jgi:hypothetical protein
MQQLGMNPVGIQLAPVGEAPVPMQLRQPTRGMYVVYCV